MSTTTRLRGFAALIRDVVEHGATAIQHLHLATAARPFTVLEALPGVSEPARVIHVVYDSVVSNTYDNVRLINRGVGYGIGLALDAVDRREARAAAGKG